MKCQFPEGLGVSLTKINLRVEVTFSSKKSLSFSTNIEFKDTNGNTYTIPVSGTADNCLFTNFSFL